MSETETQAAILDYLRLRGHFCFRVNQIPATFLDRHGERQFRRFPKYAMKGVPDIVLIHEGKFFGVECKSEKGKLSSDQVEFERKCVAAGGEYIVARSIDDVQQAGL
jgi:hypothetical protein